MTNNQKELQKFDMHISSALMRYKSIMKAVARRIARRLIAITPVLPQEFIWNESARNTLSGSTRANWKVQATMPDTTYDKWNTSEEKAVADAIANIQSIKIDDNTEIIFANSSPAINALEYGNYPNPPKRGSVSKTGTVEQRSSGGYSRLLPTGFTAVIESEFETILREEIRHSAMLSKARTARRIKKLADVPEP